MQLGYLCAVYTTAGANFQCGRSVDYNVPHTPFCLHHNVTISTPVRAVLGKVCASLISIVRVLGPHLQVSTWLQLVPGQPVELHPLRSSSLTLNSSRTLCYFLSKQRCYVRESEVKGRGRDIRNVYTVDEGEAVHSEPSCEL